MKKPSRLLRTALAVTLAAALGACAHQAQAPSFEQQAKAAASAQVQRLAVAPALYELAYSPSAKTVYVASAGGFKPEDPASRLLRLDAETLAVKSDVQLEHRGFGVAFDEEAGRIYIGNTLESSLSVIEAESGKVLSVLQVAPKVQKTNAEGKTQDGYAHKFREIILDKANHRLFMPGMDLKDSALYVIDTRTLQVEKVLPGLGPVATGIAFDAKGGKVFIANHAGQLFVVDTRSLELLATHPIAVDQPLNLAYDNQRGQLYAVDQGHEYFDKMRAEHGYAKQSGGNQVLVLDPASGATVAAIPTAEGPVAMLIDEPRARLYVSTRKGASVDVFDVRNRQLLHRFELPSHPNSFALDPASGAVFVSVKNGEKDPKGSDESVVRLQF